MEKTFYKLQFLKKILILIITTYALLMIYTDINIECIAFCAPDTNNIKQQHNNLSIMDYMPTGLTFTGCIIALRSLPVNARIITASSITGTAGLVSVCKHLSDRKLEAKLCANTNKICDSENISKTLKASTSFESDFFSHLMFNYFIIILCILLMLLALITFTIIIVWVISHKYQPLLLFLNEKLLAKLGQFDFAIIEKIKKISYLTILYMVFFVYSCLCICMLLLLNCF